MIPITTRFGYFFNQMEQNTSFTELDQELRKSAKKIQHNKVNQLDVIDYIMKSNLFGPSEIITVNHINNQIDSIAIRSKSPDEYLRIADCLRNAYPIIKLIKDYGNYELYSTYENDFSFQIGQDFYQKGDNVLIVIRNDK